MLENSTITIKLATSDLSKYKQQLKSDVAFDFSLLNKCSLKFITNIIELSKTINISIFNISSDIFILFNIMNVDKYVDLYVSELDYLEKQHKMVNRKFNIIK